MNHYISSCVAQKSIYWATSCDLQPRSRFKCFLTVSVKDVFNPFCIYAKTCSLCKYILAQICALLGVFRRFTLNLGVFHYCYIAIFPRQKCAGANIYVYCMSVRVMIGIFFAALILIPGVYFKHFMSVQDIKFSFRKHSDLFNRDIFQDILPGKEIFISFYG